MRGAPDMGGAARGQPAAGGNPRTGTAKQEAVRCGSRRSSPGPLTQRPARCRLHRQTTSLRTMRTSAVPGYGRAMTSAPDRGDPPPPERGWSVPPRVADTAVAGLITVASLGFALGPGLERGQERHLI